jgi:pimeloyl-ACP methyl ester carboxylesterase
MNTHRSHAMGRFGVGYLHGFASTPRSEKATYFGARFAELGVPFVAPDLNAGDFAALSVSRMLQTAAQATAALPPERPLVLIGSSLGGYVAALYAAYPPPGAPPPQALVLFAPALQVTALWRRRIGEAAIARWQRDGVLDVGKEHPPGHGSKLDYAHFVDAMRWDALPLSLTVPTLVFHGEVDSTVPVAGSRNLAKNHANVRYIELAGAEHGLNDQVATLWQETLTFLQAL